MEIIYEWITTTSTILFNHGTICTTNRVAYNERYLHQRKIPKNLLVRDNILYLSWTSLFCTLFQCVITENSLVNCYLGDKLS